MRAALFPLADLVRHINQTRTQLILERRAVPPTFLGLEGLPPEGREDAIRPVVRRNVQSPEHLR